MPKPVAKPEEKKRRSTKIFRSFKGMKDVLPNDQKYWDYLLDSIRISARDYSFKRIETPIMEDPGLFVKGFSKKSKVVGDLLIATTESEEKFCLRPELNLPIVRSYIEHKMDQLPRPLKLHSIGPVFREDIAKFKEPRMLHQFGTYIIGDDSPIADVQVILFMYNLFKGLDLNLSVNINSTGCSGCREKYKEALVGYYRGKKKLLCEGCQSNMGRSPLYVLNCYEECCCQLKVDAPQTVDWLCEGCKDHFIKVLECLDEIEIPYVLNPYIVSGFDYCSKTVFEISEVSEEEGTKPVVLGAGARHDEIIEKLGGERNIGFVTAGIILEKVVKRLRQLQIEIEDPNSPDVFVAQIGEMAKKKSLSLFEELRTSGISVVEGFSKDDLKTQFEMAAKLDVKFTLILGQKEILDGTIIIRDMEGGSQEIVDFKKVSVNLKKRLERITK